MGLAAAGSASAATVYPTDAPVLEQDGGGWTPSPFWVAGPRAGFAGGLPFALLRPQWDLVADTWKVAWQTTVTAQAAGYAQYRLDFNESVLCLASGAMQPAAVNTVSGYTLVLSQGPAQVVSGSSVVSDCTVAQGTFSGLQFQVSVTDQPSLRYNTYLWSPVNDAAHKPYSSVPGFCAAIPTTVGFWGPSGASGFGPCGMVGGGLGGGTIFNDPNGPVDHSTFAGACPSPPAATWSSFDWLGPWVGYYAYCLFVPQDGFRLNPIYGAFQHTGYTDVFGVYTSIKENVSWPGGQCGTLTTVTLMGQSTALSTCGSPWDQFGTVRSLLGTGVVVGAGLYAIYVLARGFGISIPGGDNDPEPER